MTRSWFELLDNTYKSLASIRSIYLKPIIKIKALRSKFMGQEYNMCKTKTTII